MSQQQPLDPAIVALLRPSIIQILNNADLSSISAKKVRAQLAQLPPHALPPTLDLSASKKQVDEVIRDCFDQISKNMPAPPQPPSSYNAASAPPSGGLALPGLGGIRGGHTAPPSSTSSNPSKPAPPPKSTPAKPAPASNGTKPKAEPKPKKKATKKRAVADDDDDDEPRKKRAANPNNPFNRPLVLSPKLAEVCGGNEMPRHAVVKQLWAYIKSNNLQNESNKRQILCDAKLTSIFGKEAVDSFEMAKLIGSHLTKKDDA
ncbi:related to UAF30 - subunit of upstream activation factor of RNA polymerase I [Ustilago trichophora]|uniref:Related to UAF30 - subunit of upstream activation factor of RNA polymerase I n=1 Tax=Ustilago trichophora TaxID=86804 RepID=A0A5C3DYF8_9BASI|nr:related to UAF30 - subunit of upstream activation factor of RNA polymerase I [Ustilago trichophora]